MDPQQPCTGSQLFAVIFPLAAQSEKSSTYRQRRGLGGAGYRRGSLSNTGPAGWVAACILTFIQGREALGSVGSLLRRSFLIAGPVHTTCARAFGWQNR